MHCWFPASELCCSELDLVNSTTRNIHEPHNVIIKSFIQQDVLFSPRWLITSYRDNGRLTVGQQRFNRTLSSIRQTIERAIGLLKGRWRKLLFLDHFDLELEVDVTIAACVLHNFCLLILMKGTCLKRTMTMIMMLIKSHAQMEQQTRKEPTW